MQSQRKNSGSYFTRAQSTLFQNTKHNSSNKKKTSVATQTENIPDFLQGIRLCNFSLMTLEEIKENYIKTLCFLNYCHDFINKIFGESISTFADSTYKKVFNFRVPEVPNYFSLIEMFLEKNRAQDLICNKIKENNAEKNVRDKEIGDDQIIFDLQQYLPKNIGDGPGSLKNQQGIIRHYGEENILKCENVLLDTGLVKETGVGLKNFGTKRRLSSSPSRLVKSEKDILRRPNRYELKALSTTFEEILKTCNDFEYKSKEQKVIPLEFNYQNPREKGVNLVLEKFEQGDQKNQPKKQETSMEANFQVLRQEKNIETQEKYTDTMENVKDSFNLIEYALTNLRESEYSSDSDSSLLLSPKHAAKRNSENIKLNSSKGLLTENLSEILFNFQDSSVTNKKSLTVLNEAHQSQSPKKVNEMFKKISKENLRTSKKGNGSTYLNNGETFIRFMDNDNFSDEFGKEYSSKVFIENFSKNCKENEDVKITSSSDSIILNDEEFERKKRNKFLVWSKEKITVSNKEQSKHGKGAKNVSLAEEIAFKPVKSHPLKLTDKDRSLADQKMLQTIGLFTEKGDIRPAVMSMLEEKQQMRFSSNPLKNVQFRTERKGDVKVHYNVKNNKLKEIEKQVSKDFMGCESITDQHTGSNTSIHSSAVTFSSSSTVSDSDLLSMEPNSDQTVIKKF